MRGTKAMDGSTSSSEKIFHKLKYEHFREKRDIRVLVPMLEAVALYEDVEQVRNLSGALSYYQAE